MKTRGGVEEWIRRLEQYMMLTLQRGLRVAIDDYGKLSLTKWVLKYPLQVNFI